MRLANDSKLAEDRGAVLKQAGIKLPTFDPIRLQHAAEKFGTMATRKRLRERAGGWNALLRAQGFDFRKRKILSEPAGESVRRRSVWLPCAMRTRACRQHWKCLKFRFRDAQSGCRLW